MRVPVYPFTRYPEFGGFISYTVFPRSYLRLFGMTFWNTLDNGRRKASRGAWVLTLASRSWCPAKARGMRWWSGCTPAMRNGANWLVRLDRPQSWSLVHDCSLPTYLLPLLGVARAINYCVELFSKTSKISGIGRHLVDNTSEINARGTN